MPPPRPLRTVRAPFNAYGSSSSNVWCKRRGLDTSNRVVDKTVAIRMQHDQIGQHGVRGISIAMMEMSSSFLGEHPLTHRASPVLACPDSPMHSLESAFHRSLNTHSVIRTVCRYVWVYIGSDLHVTSNGHLAGSHQPHRSAIDRVRKHSVSSVLG